MSVILVYIIVFAIAYFLLTWYKIFLTGIRLAGPWAVPMLGNVQMIKKLTPEKLLYNIHAFRETYRQTYRLWLGPQLWVFLHTPEENRDALQDSTLRKAATFQKLDKLIGNGLLISHGRHWETHRKALGPAFHPIVLNSFTETITQHVDIFVEILRNLKESPVEATEYIFPCVMDVIIDTSMGKNLQIQKDLNNHYTHAFHRASALLFERMVNPLLFTDFVYKRTAMSKELDENLNIIHNLMEAIIQERHIFLSQKTEIEDNPITESPTNRKKQRCLLDTLLMAQIEHQPLSLKEIRDEVNTFVFAGVDTTTAAMSFVLYALAKYPLEQQKLVQELQNNQFYNQDFLSSTDFNKLEYLDMFIKECLRFYTIVPVTGRQTTRSTKIGDKTYAAGITLWINMYGLAHDEDIFENPNEFKPLRFSKDLYRKLPKFSYIPFSAGPHNCIGRKYAVLIMKIMCVKILQNFIVILRNPDEQLILMSQMVLKSKNGINLVFKERCNK